MDELLPEQRRTIGIILLVFGLLCTVVAGGVVALIASSRAEAAARFTESQESCRGRLQALGGEVEEIPGRLIWLKSDINEAPIRLGEASVASVLCPGWRLKTSCLGTDCPESNSMRIVLEPINTPNADE